MVTEFPAASSFIIISCFACGDGVAGYIVSTFRLAFVCGDGVPAHMFLSACPTCCCDGVPGYTSGRGDGVPGHISGHSVSNKTVAVLLIIIVSIVVRLTLNSFGARSHFGTEVFAVATSPYLAASNCDGCTSRKY